MLFLTKPRKNGIIKLLKHKKMDSLERTDAPQAQESQYSSMFETRFELTDRPPDERGSSKQIDAMTEARNELHRAMDEDKGEEAELQAMRRMQEVALDKKKYGEVETIIETPEGFKVPVEITYQFEQGDPTEKNPIHGITIIGILVLEQCGNVPAGHRITDLEGPMYDGNHLDELYEEMLEPTFPKNCGKESVGEWIMGAVEKVVEDEEGPMMTRVKEELEENADEMQEELHDEIVRTIRPEMLN